MAKLTDSMVRSASAQDGERAEFTDDGCQGLKLRVSASGAKSWAFVGRQKGGKAVRVTLGRYPEVTLVIARARADEARRAAQTGAPVKPQDGPTFGDLAASYLALAKRDKKSWRQDELLLTRPLDAWATLPAKSIRRAEILALLGAIAASAPVTANRTQTVLRKLLGDAAQDGRLDANPIAGARKAGGRERPKDRLLSDIEIAVLWQALDDDASPAAPTIRLALKTILVTCARPGEVAAMAVAELSGFEGSDPLWLIPGAKTKNGKAHIVPLSGLAVDTVRAALADPHRNIDGASAHVFRSKWGSTAAIARHSLSQATRRICALPRFEAAGLKPFTPHDLRRTGATLARAAGAPRDAVAALLNHSPDDVTDIYDRYPMLAEKRDATRKLADRIKSIVGL
jgi:integrase